MGRFESVSLAKGYVDCNPFSGKWNHHFFGAMTMDTIMSELNHLFRSIIITEQKQ